MVKTIKIALLLTLLGILALAFLVQTKPIETGIVESVQQSSSKTTIHLENDSVELIIFEKPELDLKPGNKIKFQGKPDSYRNKKQILISKLTVIKIIINSI